MTLKLKHLKFPSGIESTLRRAWTYDDDLGEAVDFINFDWSLDEFFNMLSPVEVYVRCKGFGKIRLRELTNFFLEIEEEKTIAWLKQSPDLLYKQPFRIRLKVEEKIKAEAIKKLKQEIAMLPAIEYSFMEMWEVEEIQHREIKLREELKQMQLDAGIYGEN